MGEEEGEDRVNVIEDCISVYKPTKEAMKLVDEIFTQYDPRYSDPWSHIIVAGFIANDALSIKSRAIKNPKKEVAPGLRGSQEDLKQITVWLLRKKGFGVSAFELGVGGGIVDVVGTKGKKNILVECGPCRIEKPIDYLSNSNNVLWILTNTVNGVVLHEITRGKNWDIFMKIHRDAEEEMLKKTADIMDKMWSEYEKSAKNP